MRSIAPRSLPFSLPTAFFFPAPLFHAMYPSYSPEVDDQCFQGQDSDSSLSSISSDDDDDDHQPTRAHPSSSSSPFPASSPFAESSLYRSSSKASRARQASLGYSNSQLNGGSTGGRELALKANGSREYVETEGLKMLKVLDSLRDKQ